MGFRMANLPAKRMDQCDLNTCWLLQELHFLDALRQDSLELDRDYLLWAHLRRQAILALDVPVDRQGGISDGGSHDDFESILKETGALPVGAWIHADFAKSGRTIQQLSIELGWETRALRLEMDKGQINKAHAVERIEGFLAKYFGSEPPTSFWWKGQEWKPTKFAADHVLPLIEAQNNGLIEVNFPGVYPSEREMRRFQTLVAMQLRRTKSPVRASVRLVRPYVNQNTGLLSVAAVTKSDIHHLWVNQFTPSDNDLHAVLITGYTIRDGQYCFDFLNSWGSNWGRNGHGTIDPSYWPFVRDALLRKSFVRMLN